MEYIKCNICPRKCNVDRSNRVGFCSSSDKVKIARASRHMWEEPCISGTNGSGTVFFSGCNLKCVYCQNESISRGKVGKEFCKSELEELFLRIGESGVHNINLVTPTHYLPTILDAARNVKDKLSIPFVYNCSGYESSESIKECQGIIDIFLTDIKYKSTILSSKYSCCDDYFKVATNALREMIRIAGKPVVKNGIMESGVIVRHLILPSHKNDSIDILNTLYEMFGNKNFLVSLMSQYTPMPNCISFPEINRSLTSIEYKRVTEVFSKLIFDGFLQEKSSASVSYIPDFDNLGEFIE